MKNKHLIRTLAAAGNTLAPGHYLVHFGGYMDFGGGFAQAITYQLTVTP